MQQTPCARLRHTPYPSYLLSMFVVAALCQPVHGRELFPEGTIAKDTYVGVGVGTTHNQAPDHWNDGSVTGITTDKRDTSGKIYVGYDVTENFALEASYHDFGDSSFSANASGAGPSWAGPGPVSGTNEASGYGLSAVGRWPVTERITVIGKLGMLWWKSKNTWNEQGFVSAEENSGSDVSYGAGVEFDHGLKQRIVYRFEFERHSVDPSQYKLNTLTASVIYRFP